jgi:predicted esterase
MKMVLLILMILANVTLAKDTDLKVDKLGELLEVAASPKDGFNYSFYIYLPRVKNKRFNRIFVYPNNVGGSLSSLEEQSILTKRQTLIESYIAERVSSIIVVPNFPRPNIEPPIYTHSLSRSTMLVKDGPLVRIDLQLIKMLQVAKRVLNKNYKIKIQDKYFFSGFSASAMFVNRFAILHPDLVAGVAIGAPGGWPIVPIDVYNNQKLNYPIGISDLQDITGIKINWDQLKKVPFFFYLGDKDTNDAVVFRDSYTKSDEELIFTNFGKTPVERWSLAEKIYNEAGMNAHFKLYKEVGHEIPPATRQDIIDFFNKL